MRRARDWLLTLFWLVAAAGFALYAYVEIKRDYYGQVYEGFVIGKHVRSGGRGRTYYTVEYSYEADGTRQFGEDNVDRRTYEETRTASPPGPRQQVKVKAAKVLGVYSSSYFLTEYFPGFTFIIILGAGSAGCASFSLYFLCKALSRPRRPKRRGRRSHFNARLTGPDAPGTIPSELREPVPRCVKSRGGNRRPVRWFAVFALLPFGLAGGCLIFLLVRIILMKEVCLACGFSVAALVWNSVWLLFVYGFLVEPRIEKRLCEWGAPVEGRIIRKWQRRWTKHPVNMLTCEFKHPRSGLRKVSIAVENKPFAAASEGQVVTVLCFPKLRWPTRVYEHLYFYRCC